MTWVKVPREVVNVPRLKSLITQQTLLGVFNVDV